MYTKTGLSFSGKKQLIRRNTRPEQRQRNTALVDIRELLKHSSRHVTINYVYIAIDIVFWS